MQPRRNIIRYAKKLVKLSFEGDFVSEERVYAILTTLRDNPPANPRKTLKLYLLKLRSAMRKCEARVEHAGALHADTLSSMQKDLEAYYNRKLRMTTKENSDLLAGFCIFVGDDVWDASVAGHIETLSQSF